MGREMTIEAPDEFASAHQWADSYRALGLAVIPAAGQDKIPLGKWREFQTGIPETVHRRWYGADGEHRGNFRMGFLTGAASLGNGFKLLVIDLDEKGTVSGSAAWDSWIAENELGCDPETWRARTGGGGQHIYFKYPDHLHVRNTQETIAGIDVRAEGGFVVAPPSLHRNGKQYSWLFSPFETELAHAPDWLLEKVGASEKPIAASPATTAPKSASPQQATDSWGHIVDGRDAYMRDVIWASIVDWYRECPIQPSDRESDEKRLEVYATYERKVRPQDPANTLDDEGRGLSAWEEGGLPNETDWRIVKHDLEELEAKLIGRECYGGLDLARVNDLSAFVLLFPPTMDDDLGDLSDKWIVLCRFWIPEDDILRRARRDRVPYDVWRDQGFVTATPGNATDFAFIEAAILELAARFDMRELSYDRTFAGEIVQHLQDEGLNLVQFGQGFLSMAAPTAELERLSVSRSLWHGGHPVLSWNASNVTVRHDPAGNIKPDKERSTERIDGIVAICNALGRALIRDVNAGRSVYQTRGALVL